MTEHGFGKITLEKAAISSKGTLKKFAKEISKVHGVIQVHIQKQHGSNGDWKNNPIIFEFGHVLANCGYATHDDFFNEIKKITVSGHSITSLEHWITEDSHP